MSHFFNCLGIDPGKGQIEYVFVHLPPDGSLDAVKELLGCSNLQFIALFNSHALIFDRDCVSKENRAFRLGNLPVLFGPVIFIGLDVENKQPTDCSLDSDELLASIEFYDQQQTEKFRKEQLKIGKVILIDTTLN